MVIFHVTLIYIDGLVQGRRKPSALAMELRFSCINPSICSYMITFFVCVCLNGIWNNIHMNEVRSSNSFKNSIDGFLLKCLIFV